MQYQSNTNTKLTKESLNLIKTDFQCCGNMEQTVNNEHLITDANDH